MAEDIKPETELMRNIFGEWFLEVHQKVDGMPLKDALFREIQAIEQDTQRYGSGFRKRCMRVVMLRFGFEDGRKWLLREIAVEFGVTTERVRQIEQKLLRELRRPGRGRFLMTFIKDN